MISGFLLNCALLAAILHITTDIGMNILCEAGMSDEWPINGTNVRWKIFSSDLKAVQRIHAGGDLKTGYSLASNCLTMPEVVSYKENRWT